MLRRVHAFLVVWFGQVVSTFGTGLTSFALAIWVYQRTGQATQYALILFFSIFPEILFAPVAGALVDRWDRRRALILSDTGAALATLTMALLLLTHRLEVWHIYVAMVVSALSGAFQWPAYSASMTLLVPKRHLGRANGLDQFGRAGSQILAPLAAGFFVAAIDVHGVLLVDFATFLFALGMLMVVRIPRPETSRPGPADGEGGASLREEVKEGWSFLTAHRGLLYLLGYLATINLAAGFNAALAPVLVLSFASAVGLGTVISTASGGLLVGSLVMSFWGGPKRRTHGILGFGALYGVALATIGIRASVPLIAAASFVAFCCVPLINGCSQVIWQSMVPPGLQGRVFAVRRMIAQATLPLAYLIAGPLADGLFEPLLAVEGPLAGNLGLYLGSGTGRGVGLMYVILGLLATVAAIASCLSRRLRGLEAET